MSQYYEVVNGPTTVEELRQLCPNLHVDGNNIQYVINQDEVADGQYQHPNHQVIGLDQQTGSAVQLSGYQHHQPLVVDNCQQQGVYVLETADHSAQTAVTVADMQQHQQLLQQVQQVQPGQQDQQVQQVSIPQFHPQAQPQQQFHHQQAQAQAYYNNVPMPAQVQGNGLALVDTGVHMPPGQNMQVAAGNVTEHHTQHVAYEHVEAPVGFANRLTQLVDQQQSQPQQQRQQQQQHQQQQHVLSQVVQASDSSFVTLADGDKMSMEDWQRMHEHQRQRAGVITLTRQNTHVGSPVMTTVMQQHRLVPLPHQEYVGPRISYTKARIRTQNALVTNNTVQAIASPTVDHHHSLLQQHDNVISVENQVNNVQLRHTPEEVLQEQCQQTASSTQILILLPEGNQQLVNVSVPQGSCSLTEILERVGLRRDGTVVINNPGTPSEVHLEHPAVATVVKTEEIAVAKLVQQADSSTPTEESSMEGAVPSSGPIVQPAQSGLCLPKVAENVHSVDQKMRPTTGLETSSS